MTNKYSEMKKRHQEETNRFPMAFAFSEKQFEEGMKKLGLDPSDTDKVYSIGGGGFYRRDDHEKLWEMISRHENEMESAIAADETGLGFIADMFDYELSNHEYCITRDVTDTISCLGYTGDEIAADERLRRGLSHAIKKQLKWAEENL